MEKLIGSEKQVKWAEEIRKNILSAIINNENEIMKKGIKYLENIKTAKFWIDYKSVDVTKMLQQLCKGILRVNGLGSNRTAQTCKTGEITETWKEIVNDGKGGHWEQRTITI